MLKKFAFISIIAANAMAMHEFGLNINDVDLEASLKLDMGQFNAAVEPNTTFVGIKYLKPDSDYSDYGGTPASYEEVSFAMQREVNNSGFFAGMGVKLNYIDEDGATFMSIPLSLSGGYSVPNIAVPVYVSAAIHYAPKVLTLKDAKNYLEYRADVDVELIKNGKLNVGFRSIETKYEGGSFIKYNQSAYIGFKFNF